MCVCVFMCVLVRVFVCVFECVCLFVFVCVCLCVFVHEACTYNHARIEQDVHVHVRVHFTHACARVHLCI